MVTMTRLSILSTKISRRMNLSIQGSTLIETIVALVILLIILTISLTQIDRLNASLNPQVLHRAHLITVRIFNNVDLLDIAGEKKSVKGYRVEMNVKPLGNGLNLIEITVFDATEKQVYQRKKMISDRIEL